MPLQGQKRAVIADDIANFWKAYDQIVQTSDSVQQIALIGDLFIQKGTPGLQAMIAGKTLYGSFLCARHQELPEVLEFHSSKYLACKKLCRRIRKRNRAIEEVVS